MLFYFQKNKPRKPPTPKIRPIDQALEVGFTPSEAIEMVGPSEESWLFKTISLRLQKGFNIFR